jgi:hypothetical protein
MDINERTKLHGRSASIDWNLTIWSVALVAILTALFLHLASKVPARPLSDADARTSRDYAK